MTQPTASIGGLASGLDTASIINQLMQLAAIPQSRLQDRVTSEQNSVASLQTLNAKIASLATSAGDLADTAGWSPVQTTTSLDTVTAAVSSDAATTGTVTFTIDQLAQAHALRFTTSAALTDNVTGTGTTVTLTDAAGTATTIDTGDGTLQGLVDALNAPGTGVRAGTVRLDDGTYRLSVTSATTGADSQFTLTRGDGTALLGGATVVSTGTDAAITVGPDTIHSSSNTFTGLMSGIDVTLAKDATVGSVATVTVTRDVDAMTSKVKDLVDSLNFALSDIASLTSYDPTTQVAGQLFGESAVRGLRNALLDTLYPADGTTMASVGIQIDKDGKFTFDADAFSAAYAKDPASVAAMFTGGGFAQRVADVAKAASDQYTGTLTSAIKGHNSEIDTLQDSIADWDIRLDLRRQTLTRQYTAMETALGQMHSQSSWLASQIGSLPKTDTGS